MKIPPMALRVFDAADSECLAVRMTLRALRRHTFAVSTIAQTMSETFFPANSLRTPHGAASHPVSTTGGRA